MARECLEETGYRVQPDRFAALYEEIYSAAHIRAQRPDYAHKILHIFLCSLVEETPIAPLDPDTEQLGIEWVTLEALAGQPILPAVIGANLRRVIDSPHPVHLGSHPIQLPQTV